MDYISVVKTRLNNNKFNTPFLLFATSSYSKELPSQIVENIKRELNVEATTSIVRGTTFIKVYNPNFIDK